MLGLCWTESWRHRNWVEDSRCRRLLNKALVFGEEGFIMCIVSLAWLGVVFRYHGRDMMGHFVSVDKAHVSFWFTVGS